MPYHLGRNSARAETTAAKPSKRATKAKSEALQATLLPSTLAVPSGTVAIGSLSHRDRATVAGRVRQVRVQPRNGVATVEVTLADGTGDVRVVFLGRRHIPGIVPGTYLSATAVVGQRGGHLEMLNPAYTLLAAD
jgi:RecG-like helicase